MCRTFRIPAPIGRSPPPSYRLFSSKGGGGGARAYLFWMRRDEGRGEGVNSLLLTTPADWQIDFWIGLGMENCYHSPLPPPPLSLSILMLTYFSLPFGRRGRSVLRLLGIYTRNFISVPFTHAIDAVTGHERGFSLYLPPFRFPAVSLSYPQLSEIHFLTNT